MQIDVLAVLADGRALGWAVALHSVGLNLLYPGFCCFGDRDPLQQSLNVNVRHDPAPTIEMTEKVLERIEQLARRAGVVSLPAPIEGEFAVVAAGEAK
jgi:hypothetical protein